MFALLLLIITILAQCPNLNGFGETKIIGFCSMSINIYIWCTSYKNCAASQTSMDDASLFRLALQKKRSFPLKISSVNLTKFPADLITFTEEIFHGKLHFLCSVV